MPTKVPGNYDPNQAFWRNAAERSDDRRELVKLQMKKVNGNFEHRPGRYKKATFIWWVILFILIVGSTTAGILFWGDQPDVDGYILSYETSEGSQIDSQSYLLGEKISLPENPTKDGYIFAGWYLDEEYTSPLTSHHLNAFIFNSDMTLYAKWITQPTMINLSFNPLGGTSVDSVMVSYGTSILSYTTTKDNAYFGGWYINETYQTLTTTPEVNGVLYALWDPMPMKPIGQTKVFYDVPVANLDGNYLSYAEGGFWMTETETTYALWYEVYQWAIDHGYQFDHQGRDGTVGFEGTTPRDGEIYPVTTISYYDAVVWLNALSNKEGLDEVYLDFNSNMPIRDVDQVNLMYMSDRNGYRLPTPEEWDMAAKLAQADSINDQLMSTRDHFWTKGTLYSGMTSSLHEAVEYAWLLLDSNERVYEVATKLPNDSGLYDMSGNVCEYVFGLNQMGVACRGGSFLNNDTLDQVRYVNPSSVAIDQGFRYVRG